LVVLRVASAAAAYINDPISVCYAKKVQLCEIENRSV
jgi:hypothetical protein